MKRVGDIIVFLGSATFICGLIWFRYFVISSGHMAISALLMVFGMAGAVLGTWLSKQAQSRRSSSNS